MSNYIKLVQNQTELTAFKASNDFITPNVTLVYNNYIIDYNPYIPYDYSQDYLTFVTKESGTFKFTGNDVNYSIDDGKTWTTLASNTDSPTVQSGSKIMWKAALIPTSSNGIGMFSSTGRFTAQGNPMSLLYGDNFIEQVDLTGKNYAFNKLFYNCIGLTSAEYISLSATTLASNCYSSMFYGCTLLTATPELPATILATYCYSSMFEGCTSLTTAPELPATTLASNCYKYMFADCTLLTTAPELPATTLAASCYYSMFYNCSSLTTAPELPATTLTNYCYDNMFENCTSLTTAPELPAMTLLIACYGSMFSGCTSLTTAPELPATTLADFCYSYMFAGCRSLTTAPELSATTLANYCYNYMFAGCTSLTTAPELPATTLATYCYEYMFNGCTNINSITCLATDISKSNCTTSWVNGVAPTGTFKKAASMTNWTTGTNGIPSGWTVKTYYNYSDDYLTFIAQESSTFKFTGNDINYSVDGGETWITLASNTNSPTIQAGNEIMFKAELTPTSSGIGTFSSTGRFTAQCNPMSLLYGDDFRGQTSLSGKDYAFNKLFYNCTKLTSAEHISLPATTLATYCYSCMFQGCTSLTTTPKLPATTLVNRCYSDMFYSCSSLTTAPELPATTLATYCYSSMFMNCINLLECPELPATTLATRCYYNMFNGCYALTEGPELPATTLATYCYVGMFSHAHGLIKAPDLLAPTLVSNCYQLMLEDCLSLTYIKCLATDISASDCLSNWLRYSPNSSSCIFVKDPSTTFPVGISGIPSDWTIQDAS